jgi:arsenite methyltransferase
MGQTGQQTWNFKSYEQTGWNRSMTSTDSDAWSEWLLHGRHGGDTKYQQTIRDDVTKYADRVLDAARLSEGMTLADIGTGDGLVGLRAIERIGPSLNVLMTDVSSPLLRHVETLATQRSIRQQCTFFHCSAEALSGIEDASVDVVTTRSVLAYVVDRGAALREFYRVLKPGGRISIAEPVLRDEAFEVCALKKLVDGLPPESDDPFFPLMLRWRSAQFPDTEDKARLLAMTNYGERDLVRFAVDAHFADIHLELHIDVLPADVPSWEVFVNHSPHPWAPTLRSVLDERFTAEERHYFESKLRPLVEHGRQLVASRIAYLTAVKSLG